MKKDLMRIAIGWSVFALILASAFYAGHKIVKQRKPVYKTYYHQNIKNSKGV